MENLLNIKGNKRHAMLEALIKKNDPSQDMSRGAVFEREVKAAEAVADWKLIRLLLSNLEENCNGAPTSFNLQARYNSETAEILGRVRKKMTEDLKEADIKILQTQYMVLLLQVNYLEKLKNEKLKIKSENTLNETDMDMPEMMKTLCKMMLADKDCKELQDIRDIMISWRNKI